tara:strand:- start:22784 stop:24340 length:1557 start_codon:yes stop_codon:yes gene_type:complete
MGDQFYFLDEPLLEFNDGQTAEDPKDGLALFGPSEMRGAIADNIVIGTPESIKLWDDWCEALNSPASCKDIKRQRPWPPYPGFDVAFGVEWSRPIKSYKLEAESLDHAARKSDKYERAFEVSNLFLEPMEKIERLDFKPGIIICVVPDFVYENCRPKSWVEEKSDEAKSPEQIKYLKEVLKDRKKQQTRLFDDESLLDSNTNLEQYGLSPDFRRQLKARVMRHNIPVQIIKESTLRITDQVRYGEPGVNPLSDRLWNFSTAIFYKCGLKPWKTPWAREGVCYVGVAYKKTGSKGGSACCAAQMFLDSGDGLVFVGDFGPWYSEKDKEFHLNKNAARKMLKGLIKTYQEQDGRPLKEIFLHARSGINQEEYKGFLSACPEGVKLVAIRVRKDRFGPRLFRYGDHNNVAYRGKHPVLRGTFWKRYKNYGLLFTSGFKPRVGSYDGWEIPVPISITIQHGEADIVQVARDILGLTKLNYNSCQLGESEPITVKYSDQIGEILLANPEVTPEYWRHNFKFYI